MFLNDQKILFYTNILYRWRPSIHLSSFAENTYEKEHFTLKRINHCRITSLYHPIAEFSNFVHHIHYFYILWRAIIRAYNTNHTHFLSSCWWQGWVLHWEQTGWLCCPALQNTYTTGCHRKAKKIIKNNNHPRHCLLTQLPSRRRSQCRCIKAWTEKLKNSFYLKAIRLLNSHQGHREAAAYTETQNHWLG